MTVQISVTIWTVLCFLALMLVLDRLLFRPLLTFMDKRRDKVEGAREARETAVREREEELQLREESRIAAERQAMADASAALEELREENARRLAGKKADNESRLAGLRETLSAEAREIEAAVAPRTEELALAFAQRLEHWQFRKEEGNGSEEIAAPRAEVIPDGTARNEV